MGYVAFVCDACALMKALTPEELYQGRPMIRFSAYSHLQAQAACELAEEILDHLDQLVQWEGSAVRLSTLVKVQNRFWFWVLGTYEIVRTMSQYRECFSDSLASQILEFKRDLAVVRVPFAKQEGRGSGRPISTELAVHSIVFDPRDVLYEIDGKQISTRQLTSRFIAFFKGIRAEDVTHDIRWAQESHPPSARGR